MILTVSLITFYNPLFRCISFLLDRPTQQNYNLDSGHFDKNDSYEIIEHNLL